MAKPTDIIEEIEQSIESLKQKLLDLSKALEEAKTMRFKEGDVAFHKSYGNCVIIHVLVASYTRANISISREGIDLTGYHIIHREGNAYVKERDLMPITEMAKTLYSKS